MNQPRINQGFWAERQAVNAQQAIFHQWKQLEAAGCIENFRIAAGEAQGLREGWFFADSDAYKWLDAASRIWRQYPDPRLAALMDGFIALIGRAQMPDGYIFTYNQIHFPGVRWQNLQIEHELYCHGHLIEAGVSHFQATGRTDLLTIARKAADRIVADFSGRGPEYTPGHEEIEIALLRLHEATPGDAAYLEMARQFIERRGRARNFGISIFRQNQSVEQRGKVVKQQRDDYLAAHPDFHPYIVPKGNLSKKPRGILLRYFASALSGKYFQQHTPIRRQTVPVGHSVRFAYLETAAAMLARLTDDRSLQPAMENSWERMVLRRMYVTGGIGSLPGLEGFGRDYELDPEYAYAETCAALGSMFWNWELAQLTGQARYSDLFEWQLYNAASPGMGLDGSTYLYNNPLACRGGIERKPWYAVPCCPSNLSRTWADLGKYVYTTAAGQITLHQYFSWQAEEIPLMLKEGDASIGLEMTSDLPWDGQVYLRITRLDTPTEFELKLRRPSWAGGMRVNINGIRVELEDQSAPRVDEVPASGYDPRLASFATIRREWREGDQIEIRFEMPLMLRRAHPRMRDHRGLAAVTRGPLVYCLESVDHPGVDIFTTKIDPASLAAVFDPNLLNGTMKLIGKSINGEELTFIPYFLWGNRGPSQMTVWVKA